MLLSTVLDLRLLFVYVETKGTKRAEREMYTHTVYTITAANTDDATSLGCPGSLVEPTKL